MRLLLLALAVAVCSFAQPLPEWKAAIPPFDSKLTLRLAQTIPHFHLFRWNCKGRPDGVTEKSGSLYYGCVGGREVCSSESGRREHGAIPQHLIANFDAAFREHEARIREARALAPLRTDHATAMARHHAHIAAMRTAGRSPGVVDVTPVREAAVVPMPRPKAVVSEEQARELSLGSAQADVIRALGEPYVRISGDTERLTYLLTSGNAAKLDFERGVLTEVRIVPNQ